MQLILALIICFLLIFLFWFIGHIITQVIKFNEDSQLFANLIKICLGASGFLITANLVSTITSSFTWGLIASFLLFLGLMSWKIKDFKCICLNLKEYFINDNFSTFIKQNTDKYFWIVLGTINFLYGLTTFSSTKLERFGLGNTHIFNINQMLNDVYPPKDYFLTDLNIRFHFGADILAATVSKFSGFHPELSLDFLTIIFLNLAFLTLYALTIKFSSSTGQINKYLISACAFLAWGPVTYLFNKQPGETIPDKFLPKVNYLAQTRLIDSANWSGAVIHWFFEPSCGFGVFFFLIGLYLIFRFFTGLQDLKYIIALGIFLSSLSIIDFSKFVLTISGIILYLGIKYSQDEKMFSQDLVFLRNLGIFFAISILPAIIYGNCIKFDSNLVPLGEIFKLGKTTIDPTFGPIKSNTILLIIYAFGFFQAYKQKHTWTIYIIPFFVFSFIIPYFVSILGDSAQKILMSGNILGAFALPFTLDFVQKQFNLKETKLSVFYVVIFFLLSLSTLMFWALGDKVKPLFTLDNVSFKFSGFQTFSTSGTEKGTKAQEEEVPFIEYLKSRNVKNQAILSELEYSDVFSSNSRLRSLAPPKDLNVTSVKNEILEELNTNYLSSFSLNPKLWLDKKIEWIYMTPKLFRYLMSPQARTKLLNAYLGKSAKLALSNGRTSDLSRLKELYEINPSHLSDLTNLKNLKSIGELLGSNKDVVPLYIRQIAECPYLGIYSAMSNDFDGDKISDIAFFDETNKTWTIIYGKNFEASNVELSNTLFVNYKGSDSFIPVPSDYDGDMKTDIALFNTTTGRWYILKSSDSTVLNNEHIRWGGHYGEFPIPADLDGDLKTDYSVFGNAHNWPTFLSTTNNYYDMSFPSGPLEVPLYSDIDNDKKADYILYKSEEKTFYVYLAACQGEVKGEGCGVTQGQNVIRVTLGDISSRPVLSDYDGDKKVDLATWDPKSGKWEVAFAKIFLPSNNGSVNYSLILGKAGDIPMPGDYNGDGSSEIAIYDPDSSIFEIYFKNGTSKKISLAKYKNFVPACFIGV